MLSRIPAKLCASLAPCAYPVSSAQISYIKLYNLLFSNNLVVGGEFTWPQLWHNRFALLEVCLYTPFFHFHNSCCCCCCTSWPHWGNKIMSWTACNREVWLSFSNWNEPSKPDLYREHVNLQKVCSWSCFFVSTSASCCFVCTFRTTICPNNIKPFLQSVECVMSCTSTLYVK